MKIAYIYTALTSVGGADRVITNKANYFAEKLNYEVYIITDSQAGRPPVFPLSPKVKLIDLRVDFDEQYHYGIIKRTFCYFKLIHRYKENLQILLNEIKPDFVMTTCGRDLDFLNKINDGSIKIGESHIAKAYCRNFHLMEQKGFPYKQVARYWRRKQEKAIKKLKAFVVLTQHDADSWLPVRQANIIPNPYSFAPAIPSDCTFKKIISVGRLNEQKGYERLIEAWFQIAHKHPDWEVNLYGQGELKDEFEQLIKKYGITNSFHILPPTDRIMEKYCESSFYVMSSRFEGLPMVLLEAMSCGLPCISFDCPNGPSDLINNGENGYLIENGNIEQLAQAMDSMILNNTLRQKMGKNAYSFVQKYSPDNVMQMWVNLFKSLKEES